MLSLDYLPRAARSLALAGALGLAGCQSSLPLVSGSGDVVYGDPSAVENVTNEFGSTDLQRLAESMTASLLQSPALAGRPTVSLDPVLNKTSEYIDTGTIMLRIQTALVNSGKVRFVASHAEMDTAVRELQRQNQSGLYKAKGRARTGQMEGAQFRIEGEISSIVKRSSSIKDVYYVMTLKLFDAESGVIEWQDQAELRKSSRL
ncbi:penicillin-binding protein activator LpoB [Kerstersia gyiorum]|uniref:Penicillin-binding protein activator LpoB n=1 Tax=Kerstersia gyiorum TaxID=206506 RepID=A0A171KQH1_9BURK|nr:penicillin-binding protein activator LpoB [Kerstersia gyiorum]KKO71138.1 lipoprotein [Kerstersia gyiorum]MCP1631656.1 uncharacterized protein (TIGR02722 family) [Kerstersia gyiorum]MCP1636684.1 uncharacterized protein (TIGR02722 family) [Kerstersia gyiorum]MCP1671412.1 uncharacterized protein (TIGR02722 family) [Kerstersia gyiorum]MCP1677372.1 uncharacterized protein (TIGR02722 family) [Kerstersia gyiorum]